METVSQITDEQKLSAQGKAANCPTCLAAAAMKGKGALPKIDEIGQSLAAAQVTQSSRNAPLIGILSQPVADSKRTAEFQFEEYVLGINPIFVELAGSQPVYISYISETDEENERLYETLDQLNGVLFTGGTLTLIDKATGVVNPYYQTAKKIIEYAKRSKDARGIEFPILGICQGFELFGIVEAGDDKDLLKSVLAVNDKRTVEWAMPADQVRNESGLFSYFDQGIIEKMAAEPLTIHFHQWGITLDDFNSSEKLKNAFKLISLDALATGVKYITGFESKAYPFYSVLYHPEYMMMMNRNEVTIQIAKYFSTFLHHEGHINQEKKLGLEKRQWKYKVQPLNKVMTPAIYQITAERAIPSFGMNRQKISVREDVVMADDAEKLYGGGSTFTADDAKKFKL